MLEFLPAAPEDLSALARTSKLAFDNDVNYGAPGLGGPPGYDSVAWHERLPRWGAQLYKISQDGTIIGGIIVHPDPQHRPDHWHIGRIWLTPEWQNRGLGEQVMAFAESTVPSARVWVLETPLFNQRTQHFYEKLGCVRTGVEEGPMPQVLYEKRIR